MSYVNAYEYGKGWRILIGRRGSSLGDTSMNDKHATHSSTGIVEHPFRLVQPVLVHSDMRVLFYQIVNESAYDSRGVVGRA